MVVTQKSIFEWKKAPEHPIEWLNQKGETKGKEPRHLVVGSFAMRCTTLQRIALRYS